MKVLVTGASGFLGARLARRLAAGGLEVVGLLRAGCDASQLEGVPLERVDGDLRDAAAVAAAVRGCQVVFHCGALLGFWPALAREQEEVNVGGTRNVLDAALRHGVERLIFTSTINAVGVAPEGEEADEDLPWETGPVPGAYADTKRRAEQMVREVAQAGELDAVVVNPACVYGPGDVRFHDGNFFLDLARRAIPLAAPGGNCWVHGDDVVEGHLGAWRRGRCGRRYILGGENLSYAAAFRILAGELGVPPPRRVAPRWLLRASGALADLGNGLRPGRYPRLTGELARLGCMHQYYSSRRAAEELGYRHRSLQQGAAETVAWYREHGYLPDASRRGA